RIAASELRHVRMARDIRQPGVTIAVEQRDIPLERHAESGRGLAGRVLPVTEEDVKVGDLGQRAEPRRLILNRMADDDRKPWPRHAAALRAPATTSSNSWHCRRVISRAE